MTEATQDGWKPLAEVSASEGVPERTLYNWLKAKRLFPRKVDGVTLVDPAAVRALLTARAAAKAPAGGSTVSDRLAALEQELRALWSMFHDATFSGMIGDAVRKPEADLAAVAKHVRGLPLPTRAEFTCGSCGSTGLVETPIRCTSCHREVAWGFRQQ